MLIQFPAFPKKLTDIVRILASFDITNEDTLQL